MLLEVITLAGVVFLVIDRLFLCSCCKKCGCCKKEK